MLQKIQRPPSRTVDKAKISRPPSLSGTIKDVKSKDKPEAPPRISVMRTGALVVDIGSGSCKVGYAGDPMPQSLVGSVVGYPRGRSKRNNITVGKMVSTEPDLKLIRPTRQGIIVDWVAAEDLLRHVFYEDLKVSPEEHAILISDPPLSPTTNREKIAELLFERFNVPAMHVSYQSVLAVYSYGKTTGLVVDSGDGVTHSVPVHDGYNMPDGISRIDLGGHDLTTYLIKLLSEAGNAFHEKGRYIVEDIKQKCCYVAVDQDKQPNLSDQEYLVDYELPDGHVITIGKERMKCPEALFKPSVMGSNQEGIHVMTINSLKKTQPQVQQLMYDNVLLSGGSTMFEGFYSRFCREIFALVSKDTKTNVHAVPERKYGVWIGGSILASLHAFQSLWVRQEDYKERGPFIVHRRCY
ncbi:actin-like [Stegostoma tigrinum]|uniref:actin-like n=1 Tax=Stegostoma tigrinum TaxID=3053191 RepID=UPI00202B92DB|nr:actin-like [Stegostoma tigrinum]